MPEYQLLQEHGVTIKQRVEMAENRQMIDMN